MLNITTDLERIGDIFFQISKTLERKIDDNIWFNQQQRDRLNELFDLIDEGFVIMTNNLDADHYDKVSKDKAVAVEDRINKLRNVMRRENTEAMEKDEEYNIKSAMIYNNLFSSLEKVGDHIINVTESVVGEI